MSNDQRNNAYDFKLEVSYSAWFEKHLPSHRFQRHIELYTFNVVLGDTRYATKQYISVTHSPKRRFHKAHPPLFTHFNFISG